MTMTNYYVNNDNTVSVNRGSKSIIVPEAIWEQIKGHIQFLSWGEISSLVAHATNGVGIYSTRDSGNNNPNADRNWGRRR